MHILDTNVVDLIFCSTYIANALINPCSLPFTFNKIDLLLEYQNIGFKQF